MGQKVNPIGLRVGINRTWDSRWYASGNSYTKLLREDLKIREFLKKKLKGAAVSRITVERPTKIARITLYTARPGLIIGRKGSDIEQLKNTLATMTEGEVQLNIVEIRKPEIEAQLVAESVAEQLEKRIAFRRAMKRAVQAAIRQGAEGIRINTGGRLGGAEIARADKVIEGRVPLHTLRADIDFAIVEAATTFGRIGIKVWVYKGDILPEGRGGRTLNVADVVAEQEAASISSLLHPTFPSFHY